MTKIGYHASHEQFAPSELLELVKLAEQAGFDCAMSSDHFKPWGPAQGHSGFAWSWMGAAMQATTMPFGIISAPGYRYHPAIIAQAAATLAELYPERLWLALGSGQRLNEDITGLPWPEKSERNARLAECADIIAALLRGETVCHRGRVTAIDARLYSLPKRRPLLLAAAVTELTAETVGQWADGLLTVHAEPEGLERIIFAFERGGGLGKPRKLQVTLNWDESEDSALAGAFDQWRYNALGGDINWELRSPDDFAIATRYVRPADLRRSVLISSNVRDHVSWLSEYISLGFDEILLHQVGINQRAFIDIFGREVLPELRRVIPKR
jgi:coenzyme F420-dependent glucose-6-phosphate dehydrogenase